MYSFIYFNVTCDEIQIEIVHLANHPLQSSLPMVASIDLADKLRAISMMKCLVVNGEKQQPSIMSLLDECTRSPFSPRYPLG